MSELGEVFVGFLGVCLATGALVAILRAPIVGVCLLVILSPIKTLPGTYGTITLAKVVGVVTLTAVLLRLVVSGPRVRLTHCEIPLVIVVLVLLLAMAWSPHTETDAVFLLSYLSLFSMVFLVINGVRTTRQLHWVGCAFVASILLPVVSALMQGIMGEDLFGVGTWEGTSRARGTFGGPNGLAVLLACGGTYCFALMAMSWDRLRLPRRVLGTLFLLSMLWAAFYTQSRAVIFCVLAGVLYVLLQLPTDRLFNPLGWRPKRARIALCVLALAASVGYSLSHSALWQRRLEKIPEAFEARGRSREARLNDLEFAWESTLANPELALLGAGLGTYRQRTVKVRMTGVALSGVPHNIVLHFFVMGGVVGLLALGLVVRALWIHASFRARVARLLPEKIGWHWFAAWASLVASVPALLLYGAAMSNEIWLLTGIAIAAQKMSKEMAPRARNG